MTKSTYWFILFSLLAGAATVKADELKTLDIRVATIDGATQPEKIPYAIKMTMLYALFDVGHKAQLELLLPGHDATVLANLADDEANQKQQETLVYNEKFKGLCVNIDSMDAMALAIEYERLAAELLELREARYRGGLEQLSKEGRVIVDKYVDEHVTPHTSLGQSTSLELAEKHPDVFKYNIGIMCHMELTGQLPPELAEHYSLDEEVIHSDPDREKSEDQME